MQVIFRNHASKNQSIVPSCAYRYEDRIQDRIRRTVLTKVISMHLLNDIMIPGFMAGSRQSLLVRVIQPWSGLCQDQSLNSKRIGSCLPTIS